MGGPITLGKPQLDQVDRLLLGTLSTDADVSNKTLAARLGLAESTCAYRVRALREAGIITGTRAQLDLALLGYPSKRSSWSGWAATP
nr:hypothetical protein GCM10020092_081630 [Actinoplanes digitatis]